MQAAPVVCPEEEPLSVSVYVDFAGSIPQPGADAPTTARDGTCSSIGLLICTGRRSKGLQGASGKPTVSINVRQLCRKETDSGGLTRRLRGIDAPTPARTVGLPPRRGTYFLSKRKKVPKKAGGTATTGKRLLLPILTAGLAMSRAAELASLRMQSCALGARLFPPPKWAGLFPSAAYRRSAPAQSAWGRRSPCKLGCFGVTGRFCGIDEWADSHFSVGGGQTQPLQVGMFFVAWVFLQRKRPA